MAEVLRVGRLSIYFGKINRGDNGANPPWRGYCWGSDWPRASIQKSGHLYCLDLSWLMYFANIYWHRKAATKKKDHDHE